MKMKLDTALQRIKCFAINNWLLPYSNIAPPLRNTGVLMKYFSKKYIFYNKRILNSESLNQGVIFCKKIA